MTQQGASSPATTPTQSPGGDGLHGGALGLTSLLAQGIGHITPVLGLFVSLQFISSYAGVTTPLCFLIGMTVLAMAAASLGQLAKHFPSSGGYYTYISGTLHPRGGLFISWMYLLFDPMGPGYVYPYVGIVTEQILKSQYGITFPWWAFVILLTAINVIASYYGVKVSGGSLILTSIVELSILIVLALFGIFDPGSGGVNFSSFVPGNAPSYSGIYLGIVFTVSAYAGWESSGALAEESRDPRRLIPIAMVASILLIGVIDTISTWGLTLGWGTNDIDSLVSSTDNPLFVLAQHYWGWAWIFILIALWNSTLAGGQAFFNTATRMTYGMARSGVLPKSFMHLHPKYRTPIVAIGAEVVITAILAFGLGFWHVFGPGQPIFFFSYALGIALFFIYGAGNVGVMRYFLTKRRDELNLILHIIFPVVSTVALAWVTWKAVYPLPTASPLKYAPTFFVVWCLLGLALVVALKMAGKDDWLERAGKAAAISGEFEGVSDARRDLP